MGVRFKIPQMHNVLVCPVSKSVLHFCHPEWYDTIRMTVAVRKHRKHVARKKTQSQQRLACLISMIQEPSEHPKIYIDDEAVSHCMTHSSLTTTKQKLEE